MADEAKQHSLGHKKWIMEFMKTRPDLKCSYDDLVQEGEKHHCDTLGAMLKLLKKEKVLGYKQMFLMRATASGPGTAIFTPTTLAAACTPLSVRPARDQPTFCSMP